jgi:hypothetical protein
MAGIRDLTVYAADDLTRHATNDDVFVACLAVVKLTHADLARWVAEAGQLPIDPACREAHVAVVRRGIEELRDFLGTVSRLGAAPLTICRPR